MTALRSAVFNVAFFGWTVLMLVACLPALALPPMATARCQTLWARGVLLLMRTIAGLEIEIRGDAPAGSAIVAAKHQSAWDTLIWHIIFPHPAMVLKKELLSIPLYGWFCRRSQMIPVDRAGGPRALKQMLRAADRAVNAGRPVVIFPEGTRTAPGQRREYQPGVVALYRHLGIQVVPVAVNSGLYWPRRGFLKHPGKIVLEFLAPIAPGLNRRAFMGELEARIEGASEALMAEIRHPEVCG
jgi:1-acyl-sn-glycerol-3-phosphate acyltransferase